MLWLWIEVIDLYLTRASLCYGCGIKFVRKAEQNTLYIVKENMLFGVKRNQSGNLPTFI
jgi:hypothetical protein